MYQLTNNDSVLRLEDQAVIPPDPENKDYAAYLKWLDEGNTPFSPPEVDWRTPILADFSERREVYLNRLAGIALFANDATVTAAAGTFRQKLLDLPADPTVTGAASAEALTDAILALYRAAAAGAAAAAPAAKTIFNKIAR
jgi:hypothetical protein